MQCNKKRNKEKVTWGNKHELLAPMMGIVNEEDYSGLNKDVKIPRASQWWNKIIINFWKAGRFAMNSLDRLASAYQIFISRYFKSNFILIKKVCQANVSKVCDKK